MGQLTIVKSDPLPRPEAAVMVSGKPMSIADYNATQQIAPAPTAQRRGLFPDLTLEDLAQFSSQPHQPMGMDGFVDAGPRRVFQGARDVYQGNYAKGAHEVIAGSGMTAAPFAAPAAWANKLATLSGMVFGGAGAAAGKVTGDVLALTPDQTMLLADVFGIAAGAASAKGMAAVQNRVQAIWNALPAESRAILQGKVLKAVTPDAVADTIDLSKTAKDIILPPRAASQATSQPTPAAQRPVTQSVTAAPAPPVAAPVAPPEPTYTPQMRAALKEADVAALQANGLDWERGIAAMRARRGGAPQPVAVAPAPVEAAPVAPAPKPTPKPRAARAKAPVAPVNPAPPPVAATPSAASSLPPEIVSAFEAAGIPSPTSAELAQGEKWVLQGVPPERILERILLSRQIVGATGGVTPDEAAAKVAHALRTGKF